jgi:hypothetical protein
VSVGALRDTDIAAVVLGEDGVNEWCVAVTAGGVGGHAALGTGVKGHVLTVVRTDGWDELNAPAHCGMRWGTWPGISLDG